MKEYTLKSPKPLGDNDPKFGQTYWSDTYDRPEPVMFNLLSGPVGDGSRITAETVELKTSAKGTQYHRLKKVRVLGGSPTPQAPVTSDTTKILQLVYENTQQILKLLEPKPQSINAQSLSEAWQQTTGQAPDNVVEDIGDEPMNVDDIPF